MRATEVGKDNQVRTCFTINAACNQQINDLIAVLQKKRLAVLRWMIEDISSSQESVTSLTEYYYREYADDCQGPMILARFNCSELVHGLLGNLCMEVFGSRKDRKKRSLMVRVLTAYYTSRMRT